jgi:ABC-2 type transport system ATP-binding protein
MPPPPLSAVIESTELTVRVGNRTVLDGVTAEIAGNCITVLLGRTGSGKSAFLNSAAGNLPRHGGSLLVLGRDPLNRREACQIRKSCGIVPQNKALYGNYTVAEMCRLSKAFYPKWQPHLETRLLDRFELAPRHRVSELSTTQRALLCATLALSHLPPLLLLDEPFDELDPHAAQSLLQALIEAAGEASATVVIATNNPERIEAVADHALFFRQ